jgi:hypothetical protein
MSDGKNKKPQQPKTNMKSKLMMAAAVAAIAGFSTSAQANPFSSDVGSIESGSSTLVSASQPLNNIVINWGVDLVSGTYTYNYQIDDTSSDTVDSLNVSFDTLPVGALTGGNYTHSDANGVTWLLGTAVAAGGTSGTLDYTSDFAPTWGNANGADANPPSPWASDPGGQQVPVPNVPDSGTTVALLGLGLAGCTLAGRKLKQA